MKLNKLERHTAYIIMLAEYELNPKHFIDKGLCYLTYCLDRCGYGVGTNDMIWLPFHLPELYKKRPNQYFRYWFPLTKHGWKKRIELLKQCIEETY